MSGLSGQALLKEGDFKCVSPTIVTVQMIPNEMPPYSWEPMIKDPPLIGFVFCFVIWINLSNQAKMAGSIWIFAGMAFGFIKWKGLSKNHIPFNSDSEISRE